MKIRKRKVYIYKNNENDIAITNAYSKEEAIYKFSKQYSGVTGDQVKEAEYNFFNIAILQKGK